MCFPQALLGPRGSGGVAGASGVDPGGLEAELRSEHAAIGLMDAATLRVELAKALVDKRNLMHRLEVRPIVLLLLVSFGRIACCRLCTTHSRRDMCVCWSGRVGQCCCARVVRDLRALMHKRTL